MWVLGSMKELGDQSDAAHHGVMADALGRDLDELLVIGDEFGSAGGADLGKSAEMVCHVFADADWDGLVEQVHQTGPGDGHSHPDPR